MQHKLGACPISDVSIAIVISSAHRKDSLEAVHYMIDELKDKVPIWKKVPCTIDDPMHIFSFWNATSHLFLFVFAFPGVLWRR